MRVSTMRGIVAGKIMRIKIGEGMMMKPQGKRMKRVLAKGAPQLARQVADCWIR